MEINLAYESAIGDLRGLQNVFNQKLEYNGKEVERRLEKAFRYPAR
jgi:hypothetical protein